MWKTRALASIFLIAAFSRAAEVKRAPQLTPEESIKACRLSPNLRIELVAAEPLVVDPVDMAFDEDGRLYVAEMIDYPFIATPGRGRIRILEDADGDGVMDRSEIFADGLSWPTSVAVCNGGVLVAAAPSIYFFKDTDGDRKADVKQELFTGFGKQNVQALVNNIKWSIENRYVCASGGNGGKIRSLLKPEQAELSMSGRDFAFTPNGDCEALTGGGQFGNTFDDFGRRFICSNSVQARHVVLEERYLKRNPYLPVASAVASIAADGDAGPVFRTSPVEQWRIQRTQMRITGESPGLIEFGGKVAGYFTSATGITVYRGTAMGPEYYGNLFIGDVASNLVHRKTLKPNGATFRAERVDQGSEFLTSTDNSFRPVNFANGPDGALYICDMCRECIEHPVSIPDSLKQNLDLNSKGRGRIWRVTAKHAPKKKTPRLSKANAAELVEALKHPDAWWRETAQRLLVERQEKSATPLLEELARNKQVNPASRAIALWALTGLGALNEQILLTVLGDEDFEVEAQALRLAENKELQTPSVKERVKSMAESGLRARFQLALSLGEFEPEFTKKVLGKVKANDPWVQTAVLTSAGKTSVDVLIYSSIAMNESMSRAVAFTIGLRNDPDEVARAVKIAAASTSATTGLADGLKRKHIRLIDKYPETAQLIRSASREARDKTIAVEKRLCMIGLILHGEQAGAIESLTELMSDDSLEIRSAALRALCSMDDQSIGNTLLSAWKSFTPAMRTEALSGWFNRPARLQLLMEAVEKKQIPADDLSSDTRRKLRAQFKERAAALIEEPVVDRKSVIVKYRAALALKGDANNGQVVFQKNCSTCHRVNGAGHELGPDIETVSHRSPEELLEHILDPSREVQAQYVLYTISTTDGRVLEGILTSQSASSVTLKRAQSETHVILRPEIKTMLSSTRSPMPEELEKAIDLQQMADLVSFIKSRVKK